MTAPTLPPLPEPGHMKPAWRMERFEHLRSTVVTAPNGTEYELRAGDIANSRAHRLLDAMFSALATQQAAEPVYQYQSGDGSWIDQTKTSYDYNVKHGAATVRVLYTHAPATPQAEPVAEPSKLRAAVEMALEALDSAQNGLRWYQDEHPGSASEADCEMHDQIDKATEALNDVIATTPPQDVQPKCRTCNGHGLVGGHMADGSGYGEGCPDCNPEPQAVQPQQEAPHRCAAAQHSDQMVCDRCKAAWDVNDPEPPECLPASADAELAQAIGEREKDCATCAHQALPAYAPKCQQCNRMATGARRNWQAAPQPGKE